VLLRRRPAHHFVTVADGGQLGPSDFGFRDLKHLKRLWEQFRLYHRKDEKVVKDGRRLNVGRYAIMMPRFAMQAEASIGVVVWQRLIKVTRNFSKPVATFYPRPFFQ